MTRPVRYLLWIILTCILMLSSAPAVQAQQAQTQGQFGLGLQAGRPTGLTVKYYARKDVGLVFMASWNLDHFLLFSSHFIYEYPIPDSPLMFFIGPGFFLGNRHGKNTRDVEIGASAMAGLNFFVEHFEVFLQTTPDLQILPERVVYLGGAVGIRYFF